MDSVCNIFLNRTDQVSIHASDSSHWDLVLIFRKSEYSSPTLVFVSYEQAESLAQQIMHEVDGHRHDQEEAKTNVGSTTD